MRKTNKNLVERNSIEPDNNQTRAEVVESWSKYDYSPGPERGPNLAISPERRQHPNQFYRKVFVPGFNKYDDEAKEALGHQSPRYSDFPQDLVETRPRQSLTGSPALDYWQSQINKSSEGLPQYVDVKVPIQLLLPGLAQPRGSLTDLLQASGAGELQVRYRPVAGDTLEQSFTQQDPMRTSMKFGKKLMETIEKNKSR